MATPTRPRRSKAHESHRAPRRRPRDAPNVKSADPPIVDSALLIELTRLGQLALLDLLVLLLKAR